jgi:hypothetical protein
MKPMDRSNPDRRVARSMDMRVLTASAVVVGLGFLAGCGGSGGSGGSADPRTVSDAGATDTFTVQPAVVRSSGGRQITAPAEANFTIYCRDFIGPRHVELAESARDGAASASVPRGTLGRFYVVHEEDRSVLYHGFYAAFDGDSAEAERAQRDHEVIRDMVAAGPDGRPVPIFPRAVFRPLERPEPPAPSEWNLREVDAYWTVAIAVYTDDAARKQAAVESVREARRQGIEAYFLHHRGHSYVCIGSFEPDAVRMKNEAQRELARMDSENPQPLVVTDGVVPEATRRRLAQKAGGRAIFVDLQQAFEVRDPALREILEAYPYSVNGEPANQAPLLVNVPQTLDLDTSRFVAPPPTDRDLQQLLERPPL